MSFHTIYQQAVTREDYHMDAAQAKVVEQLDGLYRELLVRQVAPGRVQRLMSWLITRQGNNQAWSGCYLWGGVGRGKTWLMDLFFNAIPLPNKSRFHFHEFMQRIHQQLNDFSGQTDPLKAIAKDIAQNTRLICLDEFHVSDITDAMLLYGLLEALYQHGVVLLMTSNVMPDDLYKNGLQRNRFVPAIDLIKQNNRVVYIEGEYDYRLINDAPATNYHCPLAENTDLLLERQFSALAKGEVTRNQAIHIHNRPIQFLMQADNILWFEFDAICDGPRAASDYLYLAANYEYVIISNIYKMGETHDDVARRFISLVDAFYDRDIGLVVSATGQPQDLYVGSRFREEFKRTASRLEELKSKSLLVANVSSGPSYPPAICC